MDHGLDCTLIFIFILIYISLVLFMCLSFISASTSCHLHHTIVSPLLALLQQQLALPCFWGPNALWLCYACRLADFLQWTLSFCLSASCREQTHWFIEIKRRKNIFLIIERNNIKTKIFLRVHRDLIHACAPLQPSLIFCASGDLAAYFCADQTAAVRRIVCSGDVCVVVCELKEAKKASLYWFGYKWVSHTNFYDGFWVLIFLTTLMTWSFLELELHCWFIYFFFIPNGQT